MNFLSKEILKKIAKLHCYFFIIAYAVNAGFAVMLKDRTSFLASLFLASLFIVFSVFLSNKK